MKKPFERLTAHGCAIYQGEHQVATTDPESMMDSFRCWPTDEDMDRAKMFAAAPDAFHSLWSILRCCKMAGPVGTTAYLISDEIMDLARGVMLMAGIDHTKPQETTCSRCGGSGEGLNSEGVRVLCVNCNGRGER